MPQLIRFPIFVLLLALAGCGSMQTRQAASCSGPMVAMNPGQWTPTAEDLR